MPDTIERQALIDHIEGLRQVHRTRVKIEDCGETGITVMQRIGDTSAGITMTPHPDLSNWEMTCSAIGQFTIEHIISGLEELAGISEPS